MRTRPNVIVGILCLVGAAAGYLAFEWRVREQLMSHYSANATPMMVINQSLDYWPPVDDRFARKPSKSIGALKTNETFTVAMILGNEVVFHARVRTNNLGFLSDKPYRLERDPARPEYRIYFAGDSMTGTTTINRQWVDLVEDLLNASEEARRAVGGRHFRTINGGVPGAGFKFFWDYYARVGQQFDPDLIIVNYIESDFPRVGKSGHEAHTDDEGYMIEHAATYVKPFLQQRIPVVFTLMPLYQDLYPRLSDWRRSRRLKEAVPEMDLVFMHERLPWHDDQVAVRRWYNLPYDGHMSDVGGALYAAATAELVVEKLTGKRIRIAPTQLQGVRAGASAPVVLKSVKPDLNLFKNGNFAEWRLAEDQGTDVFSAALGPEWTVVADGARGRGRLQVGRVPLEIGSDPPTDAAPDAAVLRVRSSQVSEKGISSIIGIAHGWRNLAGTGLVLAMQLRAPPGREASQVKVHVAASFGRGRTVERDRVLFFDDVALNSRWRQLVVPIRLPNEPLGSFGAAGTEHVRVQIMATGVGERLEVELANVILAPESTERARRDVVQVGNRSLPVAPFVRLRAEIDKVFVETRRRSWRPYGILRLLRREVPYGFLPAGVPYRADFVPLMLGTDPPEEVLLNMYCTKGEISLANLDCYHSYQVYAR